MRLRTFILAALVVGCAGKEVRLAGTGEPNPYFGRDASNPEIPKQDAPTYSPGIETVDAPPSLIGPEEGLAENGDAYRIARHAGNDVETVDGTDKWSGTLIHARLPKFGEPTTGELVFYLDHSPPNVSSARSAKWKVGKVEGRDPLLGKIIVAGHKVDPDNSVLIPLESIPEK